MILADVFETFRNISLMKGRFEIDPAHYVTAPQMAWDAMLKKCAVTLDLISDTAMYLMIEGGMRGGVCMISRRYAKANNPGLGPLYDPNLPTSYIAYLDANNLYGWAMSQFLPMGDFKWVDAATFHLNWRYLNGDSPIGYFVECDLEYPPELHELHNDYP